MRVLFACGGTAGHIHPALAIADALRLQSRSLAIAFAGRLEGREAKLIPGEGYPFYPIHAAGLPAHPSPLWLRAVFTNLLAPYDRLTRFAFSDFMPDVVVGTGGYVCWPVLRYAQTHGIATALHESNAIPGKATQKLAARANRIFVNFPQTLSAFSEDSRVCCVGNPLRAAYTAKSRESARRMLGLTPKKCYLLAFGGSGGAERLNDAVLELMRQIKEKGNKKNRYQSGMTDLCCLLASGERDAARSAHIFREYGLSASPQMKLVPYIENMPVQMAAADLIVCRAGAMTLSEIALLGLPAVVVPSPYVANNHQYENALSLSRADAAVLLEEKNLSALPEIVFGLLRNPANRRKLSEKIRAFSTPNAAERIAEEILRLAPAEKI